MYYKTKKSPSTFPGDLNAKIFIAHCRRCIRCFVMQRFEKLLSGLMFDASRYVCSSTYVLASRHPTTGMHWARNAFVNT